MSTNATKLKEKKKKIKKKSRRQYKRTPWKNSADGIGVVQKTITWLFHLLQKESISLSKQAF